MSISSHVREQLVVANLKPERFREIIARLFSYGVIVRDDRLVGGAVVVG